MLWSGPGAVRYHSDQCSDTDQRREANVIILCHKEDELKVDHVTVPAGASIRQTAPRPGLPCKTCKTPETQGDTK